MNRSAISLGRILGIPIGLDYSWFLIFALPTWSLATSHYKIPVRNITLFIFGGVAQIGADLPNKVSRLFVTPNGFAEYFGAPRGDQLNGPDQLSEPGLPAKRIFH